MALKKNRRSDDGPRSRAPLILREKELLIRTVLRCPELFAHAVDKLSPTDHFTAEDESWLGFVLAAVQLYHEDAERLDPDKEVDTPTAEQLRTAFEKVVSEASEDDIDEEDIGLADNFIRVVFKHTEEDVQREKPQALKIFEYLLQEGLHRQTQERFNAEGEIPDKMPELLRELADQAEATQALTIGKLDVPFPDGEEYEKPLIKIPTGCTFLDHYMGGGQAAGEVYGLCAPYGVCKTLLAVQLGVERAKYEQARYLDAEQAGRPIRMARVYMVFYEEGIKSVLIRCQSYAAQIERKIIEDRRFGEFSVAADNDYKNYEKAIFKRVLAKYEEDKAKWLVLYRAWKKLPERERAKTPRPKKPQAPPAEKERYEEAKAMMNWNMRLLDFTGRRPEYKEAAANMVQGIKAVIDHDQRMNENPGVSMVIVDYAGAAADRCLEKNNWDTDRLRHLIGKMPMRLKTNIAIHYQCPVWVMHQLNAESNSRAAGVAPKTTDTAEAKNFNENLDFAFMVGTKSDESMAVIRSAKQRREAIRKETIVKIDGLLCRIVPTSNYVVEGTKIMRRDEADRVHDRKEREAQRKKEKENNSEYTWVDM